MMWQDLIYSLGLTLMVYALIPQVIRGFKQSHSISLQTSFLTICGLFLSIIVFMSLSLYFSSIMNIITMGLWIIIYLQSRRWNIHH
jgi:hypothetical protein